LRASFSVSWASIQHGKAAVKNERLLANSNQFAKHRSRPAIDVSVIV
jgi:hypothetical protein